MMKKKNYEGMESTRACLVTADFSSPFPHLAGGGGEGEKDKLVV